MPYQQDKQPTEKEIERERGKWERQRRKEHLDYIKPFSFHTSPTFMDYLHSGEVKHNEAEAACLYEYSRELKDLWEAAKERDKARCQNPQMSPEQAAMGTVYRRGPTWWGNHWRILQCLNCESFPGKDWQQLTPKERETVMKGSTRQVVPSLVMPDTQTLTTFLKVAPWADRLHKLMSMSKRRWPLLQFDESHYWALFTLDYSKSETELVEEFRAWLKLPKNRRLLERCRRSRTATPAAAIDRLRDLAAWRLYRECGNDVDNANRFASAHRKQRKPFRNATDNQADLFSDDSDARRVQARAWKFLLEHFPQKFGLPSEGMLAVFAELQKIADS